MTIRILISLSFLLSSFAHAQKNTQKLDLSPIGKLRQDIEYLASDALEGRLMGSKGEALAANYIQSRFIQLGISPYKSSKFQWEFAVKNGRRISEKSYFKIFESKLNIGVDVISMPYGVGDKILGSAMPKVDEPDNVWLVPLSSIKTEANGNINKALYDKAKQCIQGKSNALIFYNDIDINKDIHLENHPNYESLTIPIVFITYNSYIRYIKPNVKRDWIEIDAKLGYEDASIIGRNVIGYIDNTAPLTIVLSAHYDHLGKEEEVFNGANNNASGVASLLALAELIKLNNLRNYNFLFLVFSGSKANHQGVVSFLKDNEKSTFQYDCFIDFNMLGRYNQVKKQIFVSGVGTNDFWSVLLQKQNKGFQLMVDSAGIGYGAYSFFYKRNIPVLSFSTGYMSDYAKPSDDVSKINFVGQVDINNYIYRILSELDKLPKLVFRETTNIADKLEKLKTDLGIIPDYAFNENGIKIATCLLHKMAYKIGLEPDDIIIQIGDYRIIDFDDYIEAFTKLAKGKEVPILVKRGKSEFKYFIVI
jgi:aminopeptidase YwaD